MPNPTPEQLAWVARTFGIDLGGATSSTPPSSAAAGFITASDVKYAATTVKNVVGDITSEIGIATEKVTQTALGIGDSLVETGEKVQEGVKGALGWGTPPTAAPTGPVTLTSQTEATSPANRARLKLGVGERVTLTVTGGAANWTISGAKLSAKAGTVVTMTAPIRPGTVTVTADVGGTTASLTFNVVAPSTMLLERTSTEHYNGIPPNAGMRASVYLGPDDVNFGAAGFVEDEISAKASGSWRDKNGEGHSPGPFLPCSDTVVAGKGSDANATDHCWSGYIPGLNLTDWTGQISWRIPWHWQCGSGAGLIGYATQLVVTDAAGNTTISKAGGSYGPVAIS